MNEKLLTPDLNGARKHLLALSNDPNTTFTFQTFDDFDGDTEIKRHHLVRIIHGTLDECASELTRLNQEGAGIFVTVNETDLKGRKKENIIALRALFVDSDNGDLPPLKLQPSIMIQSKRGQHAYWMLNEGESLESFTPVQISLSTHLKTDSSVKDLPRVMRLAGFYHMKDPSNPFLVKVIETNQTRFTIQDILNIYQITHQPKPVSIVQNSTQVDPDLYAFTNYVNSLPLEQGSANRLGGRNNTLLRLIREGFGQGLSLEQIQAFVRDYCNRSGLSLLEGENMLYEQEKNHAKNPFKSFQLKSEGVKKMKENKSKPARTSTIISADGAYDIARPQGGKDGWIYYNRSKQKQALINEQEIQVDGNTYISSGASQREKNLILPTGLGRPMPALELIEQVKDLLLSRFWTEKPELLDYLSLYILAGYVYDHYPFISYFSATGPAGSGKSRLVSTAAKLSYNCLICTGADTDAAFIRALDRVRGTIAMDEAQKNSHDPSSDFHKVLAVGNSQDQGFIQKCVKNGKNDDYETHTFCVFGSKNVSQRYSSGDDAIVSRTFEVELPPVELEALGDTTDDDIKWDQKAAEVRNNLLLYRQRRNVGEIEAPRIESANAVAKRLGLNPRELQVSKWLIEECPSHEILVSLEKALKGIQQKSKDNRSNNYEADVLYTTYEKMRSETGKSIRIREIGYGIDDQCGWKREPRAIAKVLRGNNLKVVRCNDGTHVVRDMSAIELAIKRLGLDLPVASSSSLASLKSGSKNEEQ